MTVPGVGVCRFYQEIIASNNILYTIVFYHKIPNGHNVTAKLFRGKGNDASTLITLATLQVAGTGAWTRALIHGVFPSTEDDKLRIQFEASNDNFTGYIDTVNCQEDYSHIFPIWLNPQAVADNTEQMIFQKQEAANGVGYSLAIKYVTGDHAINYIFRLTDGVSSDSFIVADAFTAGWELLMLQIGHNYIDFWINGVSRLHAARSVYGDTNTNQQFTLFKSDVDNNRPFQSKIGDIAILRDIEDDGTLALRYFNEGIDLDPHALAVYRWSSIVKLGHDQTEQSKNLTMTVLTGSDVTEEATNVPPDGYPSYPMSEALIDDQQDGRVEAGWWADFTYPGSDLGVFIDSDALLHVEVENRGKIGNAELNNTIHKEIVPIDCDIIMEN